MTLFSRNKPLPTPWCLLLNLLWLYLIYGVCRVAFVAENWAMFSGTLTWSGFWRLCGGGLVFDTSAIMYTNMLYLLLVVLPVNWHERRVYSAITKGVYVTINGLAVVANLADSVFFPFNLQRSTALVFKEFGNETNISRIVGIEFIHHWYFVLLAIILIFALWRLYVPTEGLRADRSRGMWYLRQSIMLVICVPLIACGMRGGATASLRPITVSNAHQYASQPLETAIVLNTPFSVLRTIGVKHIPTPTFFSPAELDSIYSPLHYPMPDAPQRKKNVVILIVESFAKEFVGALNTHLDEGKYGGYTEFIDSLLPHTYYHSNSFANAGISIDAMPAVLASLPRMQNSFILTPYSLDKTNSLATELGRWGYYTAFFHGAHNDSMGFQAFARSIGFDDYFGRTEYGQDPRFDGDKDFDGTWAIWDEPFLQYFCLKMNEMPEPFFTTVFTASSHHPFALPDEYKDVYKDEGIHKLHKCIRYTDNALRHFFATAKEQPWYDNTIFVLTADHASSKTTHGEYKATLGHFKIPILFIDPSGELPCGEHPGIAQQLDIMPTILNYLGYDKPYLAFGIDLFNTPADDTWAFNWDYIPQFVQGDYLLQMSGDDVTAVYKYRTDTLLLNNLRDSLPLIPHIERNMKAFMQSCLTRMKDDRLTIEDN